MASSQIQLWTARTQDTPFAALWDRHAHLLPAGEKEKVLSYRFDKDRTLSLVSKVLLRKMLSTFFTARAPESWRFAAGNYGKPFVDGEISPRFNLSHTEGLVACALSTDTDVGVDVEVIGDRNSIFDIAPTVFTPAELAALHEHTDPTRRFQHFFRLWTLKESYIKCVGKGLSIPLQDFEFDLRSEKITFKANHIALAKPHHVFCSTLFGERHILSLAVQATNEDELQIEARDFSDLESCRPMSLCFDYSFR